MNNKPTKEEYDKAKENISMLNNNIELSQIRIMKLIDLLAAEKHSLNTYNSVLDKNKNIVILYEAYNEVEDK